ncbi:tail completion protein gp17 [Pseudorhizobium sp. NPDC055634]
MEETLTSLLASVASGRRYWGRAPQTAARPFIVLTRIDGLPNYHMQGASGFVSSRVQIDAYADTFTAATTLARQVKALLSGHKGGSIQAIFIESERNLPAADAGEVTSLFRTSIDITVHHGENP